MFCILTIKYFLKKDCLHFFSFTMGHDFKIFYLNKGDNYTSSHDIYFLNLLMQLLEITKTVST